MTNPLNRIIENVAERARGDTVQMSFIIRSGIALGIVVFQVIIFALIRQLFKALSKKIDESGQKKIKPFRIKKITIFNQRQIINIILFLFNALKYVFALFQLFLTVPLVFLLFPATEKLAVTLFGYILTPVKGIFFGIIGYVPNLITIIVIVLFTRYVIRGLKFFSEQIRKGKLVIPGFYADWANPTYNILRALLWAFTLAIVFPYLPGSDSRFFQGISVFMGIILSFGSTTSIGNLVAGIVITYMRPFKIGDRIQIQGSVGFVVEKSLMVVRIKTHKNEYITFPNLQVLQASVINYNTSSEENEEGLILYAVITFNYNTPWRLIHEILIEAALKTDYAEQNPMPFVLQTALDDFYTRYEINFYTKKVDKVPAIYSSLFANIQDGFRARGLDMTAPHFRINLPPEAAVYTPPDADAKKRYFPSV